MQSLPLLMAKRGMLPKFRPAQLGREAPARPSIRPVKPSPPPPPPSPPRRHPSGVGPRGASALLTPIDNEKDITTAVGHSERPTMDRAPATMPTIVRDDDGESPTTTSVARGQVKALELSFEDETQARPVDDHILDRMRDRDGTLSPLTQAPSVVPPPADMNIPYDSLPSLEVRRPYDTYEAEFSERDPATQMHALRKSDRVKRAERREPSYQEPSYKEGGPSEVSFQPAPLPYPAEAYEPSPPDEQEYWGRREGSGPRQRPVEPVASYAAPVPAFDEPSGEYNDPVIPPAPAVPMEARTATPFVMGVQPVRAVGAAHPNATDAWPPPRHTTPAPAGYMPPPQMPPMHAGSSMPPAYPQTAMMQHPGYAPVAPRGYSATPQPGSMMQPMPAGPMMHQAHPAHPAHPASHGGLPITARAHTVGHELRPASAGPKIGRFAWFVAGVAFGVTFAIFATGVLTPGAPKPLDDGRPVAAATATTPSTPSPVVTAPPSAPAEPAAPVVAAGTAAQLAAATAPPVMPQLPSGAAVPAPAAPAAPAAAAPAAAPPVTPATLPAAAKPAPVAKAPAPPPRRAAPPPRRPSSQASAPQVAKPIGGADPVEPETRASAPVAPPPEAGDLLGAALR